MRRRGELLTLGENAADVGGLLAAALDRFGMPKRIASDRWREAELRDAIKGLGIGGGKLDLRGMGFKDGAEDVRAFTRACLEGKVTPVPSLLLSAAMSEARTLVDPAGNRKLAKGSEGGRRLNARMMRRRWNPCRGPCGAATQAQRGRLFRIGGLNWQVAGIMSP